MEISDAIKDLPGSTRYKERVTNFSDKDLEKAFIAMLECWDNQNTLMDTETDHRMYVKMLELEAKKRGMDLSNLESPEDRIP